MRTVLVAKHVNGLPITEAECLEQSSTRREEGILSALSFGGFSPWSLDKDPCFGPEVRQRIMEGII